jgi:hypothetical protein
MNATEAKKTLFKIRNNLIDDKQKHAIWMAIMCFCTFHLINTQRRHQSN